MYQPNSDERSLLREYIDILQIPSFENSKKLPQLRESEPKYKNASTIQIRVGYPMRGGSFCEKMDVLFFYGPSLSDFIKLNRKLITSFTFFHKSLVSISFKSSNDFFKPENTIFRIVLAIICDNAFALKVLFDEYQLINKDKPLIDLITVFSLAGLAAANGCTEVIKYFISMNINFEQKTTLHLENIEMIKTSEIHPAVLNEKSVLNRYDSCYLEMSPLALALSAAPAMPREEATKLIDTLLNANVNYDDKIIKRWTAVLGYYGRETQESRSQQISLFEFDQTGILDELVKKRREHKPAASSQINQGELQNKPENYSGEISVLTLKKELDEVKEENKLLKAEIGKLGAALGRIENMLSNKESAKDFNLTPPGQNNSSQQFFRGNTK